MTREEFNKHEDTILWFMKKPERTVMKRALGSLWVESCEARNDEWVYAYDKVSSDSISYCTKKRYIHEWGVPSHDNIVPAIGQTPEQLGFK